MRSLTSFHSVILPSDFPALDGPDDGVTANYGFLFCPRTNSHKKRGGSIFSDFEICSDLANPNFVNPCFYLALAPLDAVFPHLVNGQWLRLWRMVIGMSKYLLKRLPNHFFCYPASGLEVFRGIPDNIFVQFPIRSPRMAPECIALYLHPLRRPLGWIWRLRLLGGEELHIATNLHPTNDIVKIETSKVLAVVCVANANNPEWLSLVLTNGELPLLE